MKKISIILMLFYICTSEIVIAQEPGWMYFPQEYGERNYTISEDNGSEYVYSCGISEITNNRGVALRFAEHDFWQTVISNMMESDGLDLKTSLTRYKNIAFPKFEILEVYYEMLKRGQYRCYVLGRIHKDTVCEMLNLKVND